MFNEFNENSTAPARDRDPRERIGAAGLCGNAALLRAEKEAASRCAETMAKMPPPSEIPRAEIPRAVSCAFGSVNDLEGAVARLEDKLGSVMRPAAPCPPLDKTDSITDLGNAVSVLSARISLAAYAVHQICDRLEV